MGFKFVILLAAFYVNCAHRLVLAQERPVLSEYLSMKDGLSHDAALTLLQDSRGFIWIGTYSGLNKFDGYEFTTYLENPSDPNGLQSGFINCLWEDPYKRLWIGTSYGLQLFELTTEKFQSLTLDSINPARGAQMQINRIRERKDGKIWICSKQAIYLADPKDLSVATFISTNEESPLRSYFDIAEAADETIWVAGEGGLVHYDLKTGKVDHYIENFDDPKSLAANTVKKIYIDTNGSVWAGTRHGLDLFNPEDQSFSHFSLAPSWQPESYVEVQVIQPTSDGELLVGSTLGLFRFSPATGKFKSVLKQFVWSVLPDKQGTLWVGSAHGVYKLLPKQNKFNIVRQFGKTPVADVRVFAKDNSHNIWFSVYNPAYQLFKYDPFAKQFFEYEHNPSSPFSFGGNSVRGIVPYGEAGVWLTSYLNLQKFNWKDQTFSTFELGFDATAILIDSRRSIWVGGWEQVGIFDIETSQFKPLPDYPPIEVKSIKEDKHQNIWIASIDGLFRYSLNSKKLTVFKNDPSNPTSISHDRIYEITIDKDGTIWLGTAGGINKMIPGTEDANPEFIHWRTSNSSLPHNDVWSVVDGKDGSLWLSCGNRISHFFPQSGKFRNYDHGDGLHGQSIYKGLRGETGEMYFSSRDGIIKFHPDSLYENPYVPPVVLSSLSLHNQIVPVRGSIVSSHSADIALDRIVTYTDLVELQHDQNDLTIQFAALNYVHQEKNQYKYKLEPYETKWVATGAHNRVARYTNLSPGRYTFHVTGSNNDGIWNDEGAKLIIIIAPPWWQTWWAYTLYTLIFAGFMLLARRSIVQRERLNAKFKMEHLELEKVQEMDKLKTNFFANISHEFRTPLTLILEPLKEMYNGTFSGDYKPVFALMIRNAQRLLRLINQLLDLSRLDVGKMELHTTPIDLVVFLREATAAYESIACNKKIKFFFYTELHELTIEADMDKVEKVVHNLLSNAFKFTGEYGEVLVNLRVQDERWAAITVKDTGMGIPADQLDKIFDRFYQVDSSHTREYEGSGLGMALAREMVMLHHGSIAVDSVQGKGSTFTVLLPLGAARPDPVKGVYQKAKHSHTLNDLVVEGNGCDEVGTSESFVPFSLKPIVLIVEDNADMRQYIRRILTANYQVIEAVDGHEGLKKALENVPDLIVSDVMMPQMDGYKLCENIKTNELTSHIPVVLLTAKADYESKITGLETGADDYLAKPFDTDELKLIVRNRIEARNRIRDRFTREVTLEPREIAISSFDERFINKVLAIIEEHMDDESFSIEQLSREVGYSNMHLYRKIKALAGQTPSQFLRTIRLKRAAALLAKHSDSVTQIAYSVGFSSLSYFNKCFKEQFGVTPGKFATLKDN